jgi:hypothetical protein
MSIPETNLLIDDMIDISWVDEETDVLEKEPMDKIQCIFIYVQEDQSIKQTVKLVQDLDNQTLPQDKLLYLINKMKTYSQETKQSKYRIQDILLYNIDSLETQYLKNIDQELTVKNPLKSVNTLTDIHIPKSLCIFHEINALYFIFQEIPVYDQEPMKPIIKIHQDSNVKLNHKKTKKVTFKDGLIESNSHNTRRVFPKPI